VRHNYSDRPASGISIQSHSWSEQLSHQLQALPPFEAFWGELPKFFAWLVDTATILVNQLPAIPSMTADETVATSIVVGSVGFGALDRVRLAAVNRLCIQLD